MKIKSYEEAVEYLEGFIGKVRFEITSEFIKKQDPLERMRVFLSLLGNPQNKFPSVLVGGTSGKGSTTYLISHILTTAGYKTGLTISPHLQKVNERLQINGQPISDDEFIKMVGSIVDTIELMKKTKVGAPSYFEILIAMAFLYFACPPSLRSGAGRRAQQKADIAVVEVGMGGEFDATNTVYPLVAVLTNVSLDHTNVLGGTVKKIARTKVGIIKGSPHPLNDSSNLNLKQSANLARANASEHGSQHPLFKSSFRVEARPMIPSHAEAPRGQNLIVVTGVKQPSVIKIVEDKCKEVGAKLYRLGKDFDFKIKKESLEGSVFDLTIDNDRGLQLNDLKLLLLGKHQVENASLAIQTVLQLKKFGFVVSEKHIRQALKTAFFSGRFEVIKLDTKILRYKDIKRRNGKEKSPNILISQYPNISFILDGAHNPTKMKAFLTALKKLYPKQRKIFVVGFKFDKDVKKMLKQIVQAAYGIVITEFRAKTDISTNASIETKRILEDIKKLRYYDTKKIIVENDSRKALDKALNILVSQYPNIPVIIVVTGSLYLVGEVRDYIMKNPK